MDSTWIKVIPAQNCYRFYRIIIEHDLFAAWRVRCEWGRIGSRHARHVVRVFEHEELAEVFLLEQEKQRLRRGYQLQA